MKYLNLLSTVIITKGKYRTCLIDIESNHYCVIPTSLVGLFNNESFFEIDSTINNLDSESRVIFKEYISFLINNGFAILSNEKIKFKRYNLEKYKEPNHINNIVLDINDFLSYRNKVDLINSNNINSMQIRVFAKATPLFIEEMIEFITTKDFNNIELVLNHNNNFDSNIYKAIYHKYRVIARIIVMNYQNNTSILNEKIFGVKTKLNSVQQCGIISKSLFCTNINSIQLSNSYNSCLYKKISIDVNGEIKNCPSMPYSYGNIKETTLEEALNKEGFKKYWNITKDEVEVCKDCEFRYICTDCRAYTERNHIDKEGLDLSKPLKCGYDPYTGEWEEWSTNPFKQKSIDYYELRGIIEDI